MDLYHTWFDLKPGVSDVEFSKDLERYLGALRAAGRIAGHRLSRRELGFGPEELGEFHVVIEGDGGFRTREPRRVAARGGEKF